MEINSNYPNIGSLVFANSEITKLTKTELKKFPRLEYLEIGETKLNE